MFGHLLKRGAVVLCLAAVLALPVCAEGRITTDMTMKEIRSDPAIAGSGVSTYCKGDADSLALRRLYENKTLLDYVGETTAQDSADGLNIVIENYEAGKQVTWQVYSPEEVAADSSLGCVQLFWFPGTNADGKYALVVGGNAAMKSGDLNEGIAVAAKLNEMGYSVFVLRYRIWWDISNNGPCRIWAGRCSSSRTMHSSSACSRKTMPSWAFPPAGSCAGCSVRISAMATRPMMCQSPVHC